MSAWKKKRKMHEVTTRLKRKLTAWNGSTGKNGEEEEEEEKDCRHINL